MGKPRSTVNESKTDDCFVLLLARQEPLDLLFACALSH